MEETEVESELLEQEDESMPLVDSNRIEDRITNSEFETSGGSNSGDTSFDKLPAKAKELLMFQNRNRLRSKFLDSSPKKQKQYHQGFLDRNRGKHRIRPHQNHVRRFGVYKPNMLSSKKRFLLTKNKHPWMRHSLIGMF